MVIDSEKVVDASIKNGLPRQLEAAIALVGLIMVAPLIALTAAMIAVSKIGRASCRERV